MKKITIKDSTIFGVDRSSTFERIAVFERIEDGIYKEGRHLKSKNCVQNYSYPTARHYHHTSGNPLILRDKLQVCNPTHTSNDDFDSNNIKVEMSVYFCPFDCRSINFSEPKCICCGDDNYQTNIKYFSLDKLKWKKNLYEKKLFGDNYTDKSTFLIELKKNVNIVEHSYTRVMWDSLVVIQQFSIVVLFITTFFHILFKNISPPLLGLINLILFFFGYIIWNYFTGNTLIDLIRKSFVDEFFVILFLWVFSPVLWTLTDPISDDIITALCVFLTILHLSFQDYSFLNASCNSYKNNQKIRIDPIYESNSNEYENLTSNTPPNNNNPSHQNLSITVARKEHKFANTKKIQITNVEPITNQKNSNSAKFSNIESKKLKFESEIKFCAPLSLDAAVFASILLVSRLDSYIAVFTLLLFSLTIFALFPIFFHKVRVRSESIAFLLFLTVLIMSMVSLYMITTSLFVIYLFAVLFSIFVLPLFLKWIQKYKNKIHGPWNEAVL